MTSNLYIDSILNRLEGFRGVYAADNLPIKIFSDQKTPQFAVVNTKPISEDDGHWLLIARYNNHLELFDSLAYPLCLLHQNIRKIFLRENFKTFQKNNKIIQPINSRFCGFYVIARIISIVEGESLASHLEIYSPDLSLNSTICSKYIEDTCNK